MQLFSLTGPVLHAEIIYNDRGSKGFGFVTLASAKQADIALSRLHLSLVEGRRIQVNFAMPKKSGLGVSTRGEQIGRPEVRPRPTASPGSLAQAEIELVLAEVEVNRLRQELLYSLRLGF